MTNIDIDDEVYKKWVLFYKSFSKIDYPTLKNFTTKKISEMIKDGSRRKRT